MIAATELSTLRGDIFRGVFVAGTFVETAGFRAALSLARGFLAAAVLSRVRLFLGAATFSLRVVRTFRATLACRVAAPNDERTPGAGFFVNRLAGDVAVFSLGVGRRVAFLIATFLVFVDMAFVRVETRMETGLRADVAFLLFVPGVTRFM